MKTKMKTTMKFYVLAIVIVSLFGLSACNDDSSPSIPAQAGAVTGFPNVGFEQTAEVEIPFSIDKVFPLFEPQGRNLAYDWWDPATVLREAIGGTLNGLATVSKLQSSIPELQSLDVTLIVTEHDTDNSYIQYLVLWGDFELQRIDITCEQGATANSTKVVWTERNAGMHEMGNSLVTQFVQGGGITSTLQQYARQVDDNLNGVSGTNSSQIVAQSGTATSFPTVGFEQVVEVEIPFSVDEVYPLFEPEGRYLIYDWWDPATMLREAMGETLNELITVSRLESFDVFLFVTEHDPDSKSIEYLVLWDDFELQRINITCEQGATTASTKVVWTERNAGIHDMGVNLVTQFVEGGNIVSTLERYAGRVQESLQSN